MTVYGSIPFLILRPQGWQVSSLSVTLAEIEGVEVAFGA